MQLLEQLARVASSGASAIFWLTLTLVLLVTVITVAGILSSARSSSKSGGSYFSFGSDLGKPPAYEEKVGAFRYSPDTSLRRIPATSLLVKPRGKADVLAAAKAAAKNVDEFTRRTIAVITYDSSIRDMSARRFARLVDDVVLNCKKGVVQEVVVIIDSPGGSVTSYGFVYSQMMRLRALDVPVTVCIDQIGASGGYYAAVAATKIVAVPSAVVGSVGVRVSTFNYHDLMEKIGIRSRILTAGDEKIYVDPGAPYNAEAEERLLKELEVIHEEFLSVVREHRPNAKHALIKSGKHWSAAESQRLELGLVDELGNSPELLMRMNESSDLLVIAPPVSRATEFFSNVLGKIAQAIVSEVMTRMQVR